MVYYMHEMKSLCKKKTLPSQREETKKNPLCRDRFVLFYVPMKI